MSESLFIRQLGFVTALVGVVGAFLAWSSGDTLFVPFALVLWATGVAVAAYGWAQRHSLAPLRVRTALAHDPEEKLRATLEGLTWLPPPSRWAVRLMRRPWRRGGQG